MEAPADVMEVDNIETFEVLNSPIRIRILRQLLQPKAVKELAENLDVPPTRLYYHVNLLEEVGVIKVVQTRKSGAMIEKTYQAVARGFRPSRQLTEGGHEPVELARAAASVVLDGAKLDAEAALSEHFRTVAGDDGQAEMQGTLGRTLAFFTAERARTFTARLQELIEEEFDDDRDEGIEFGFTYVFMPVAGSKRADETR